MNDRVECRAPVLVLGLGNLLLRDDAVGLRLLGELRRACAHDPRIEFVDGGTLGLALSALLAGRSALLVLDAMQRGASAGTVHGLDDVMRQQPRGNAGGRGGAHQLNAGDLLLTASLLGDVPRRTVVVGIEPAVVRTGIGLSPEVLAAVPEATAVARIALGELLAAEVSTCTN